MSDPLSRAALHLYAEAGRLNLAAARTVLLSGPHAGADLTLCEDGRSAGTLGSVEADHAANELLRTALLSGEPARLLLHLQGPITPAPDAASNAAPDTSPLDLFIHVTRPPERLIIVGAVHTSIPLVTFANALGLETIVVDNRTAFATPERFGHAGRLILRWPADALAELRLRPSDSLVFLTHDAKIDNPALACALASPARYIGALGSRRTHARRLESLRESNIPEEALARIHAPIGLDLGGRSPAEIALAIVAQIVQEKYRRAAFTADALQASAAGAAQPSAAGAAPKEQ